MDKDSFFSEKCPELLYHYTTQKGLLGIIQSKRIWATHHQFLNDTQEYLHAKNLVKKELSGRYATATSDTLSLLKEMTAILDGPGNEEVSLFVASFSEDGDSLSQWRGYGGSTSGFALGFAGDQLALPERFAIGRCIYKPDRQCEVVNSVITEVLGRAQVPVVGAMNAKLFVQTGLLMELHRFALIFKDEKFREEREGGSYRPL